MKKYLVLFGIIVLLNACTFWNGNNSYSSYLEQWVGKSEYQLYQAWGQPAHVFYVSPYEKIVTYITTNSSGSNSPYGNQVYYGGMGEEHWWDSIFGPPPAQQPDIYYCKTSFTIQNGFIINLSFNGDDCVHNKWW